jgi:hypothetical protein
VAGAGPASSRVRQVVAQASSILIAGQAFSESADELRVNFQEFRSSNYTFECCDARLAAG